MELLFSYGTLQQENVQLATFGRVMDMKADTLPNFKIEMLKISDEEVVKTSGKLHHPIAVPSTGSSIEGTVISITNEELVASDSYEVKEYIRKKCKLSSGIEAWVYVCSKKETV